MSNFVDFPPVPEDHFWRVRPSSVTSNMILELIRREKKWWGTREVVVECIAINPRWICNAVLYENAQILLKRIEAEMARNGYVGDYPPRRLGS